MVAKKVGDTVPREIGRSRCLRVKLVAPSGVRSCADNCNHDAQRCAADGQPLKGDFGPSETDRKTGVRCSLCRSGSEPNASTAIQSTGPVQTSA